jgi:hypothetical protein
MEEKQKIALEAIVIDADLAITCEVEAECALNSNNWQNSMKRALSQKFNIPKDQIAISFYLKQNIEEDVQAKDWNELSKIMEGSAMLAASIRGVVARKENQLMIRLANAKEEVATLKKSE